MKSSALIPALYLPSKGEPFTAMVDPQHLKFTGVFMEVTSHSKAYDGTVKAVFTFPPLGGAYLKPGMQPEEALEIAKKNPGPMVFTSWIPSERIRARTVDRLRS